MAHESTIYGGSRRSSSSRGGTTGDFSYTFEGLEEVMEKLQQLQIHKGTERGRQLDKLIRSVLLKARSRISKDAKQMMRSDPRDAYKAVKSATWKASFGGSVSILSRRKNNGKMTTYRPERKLRQGQRGGNRRKTRLARTDQIDSYYGNDRAFILRFINAGTDMRETRYGSRGMLSARDWFGRISAWHMQDAVNNIGDLVNQATEELWNK